MNNTQLLSMMAGLMISVLVGFALHRWRQRKRVRRVQAWVKDYLFLRQGDVPEYLTINCSDDLLWPVLVDFDDSHTGARHNLQFACAGPPSTFRLLSETKVARKRRLPVKVTTN
jgi:hypothetical protein